MSDNTTGNFFCGTAESPAEKTAPRLRTPAHYPKVDVSIPDAAPRKRWTKSLFDFSAFGLSDPFDDTGHLYVAIPDSGKRLQAKFAVNTTYANTEALPAESFIDVGCGISISCPELLFVELASLLDFPHLVLLGYELCGSFSRDPEDPRNGDAAMGVEPATSTEKITTFIDSIRWVRGAGQARTAIKYVANNAWSPAESVVATIAMLPAGEFGFGMGDCILNARVTAPDALTEANDRASRVPDILFGDTHVGINYDGAVHLDLAAVAAAAEDAALNPDEPYAQTYLRDVISGVRAKAVDDIRRNRELAAAGYIVFPVTKEDLYDDGGLDKVMLQVVEAIEAFSGEKMALQRRLMQSRLIRTRRQELIWSLVPGRHDGSSRKIIWQGHSVRKPEVVEMVLGI